MEGNPYLLHTQSNQDEPRAQDFIYQPDYQSGKRNFIPEQDRMPAKKTYSENASDRYVPPHNLHHQNSLPNVHQQGFNPYPNNSPPHYPQVNHQQNRQQGYIPPQNYPHQGYAPNHNQQIVIPQAAIGSIGSIAGTGMSCPLCGHSGQQIIQKVNGTSVWIWVVVLCFLTGCCCCLPLCCDCCKDTKYLCAKCGYPVRVDKDC